MTCNRRQAGQPGGFWLGNREPKKYQTKNGESRDSFLRDGGSERQLQQGSLSSGRLAEQDLLQQPGAGASQAGAPGQHQNSPARGMDVDGLMEQLRVLEQSGQSAPRRDTVQEGINLLLRIAQQQAGRK